ncbi:MAG: phosphotransferase [Ectothiorhodospiraceae bacterium]|nr:phosphotransferase [Ectothiorhodospiraceae bacterium]
MNGAEVRLAHEDERTAKIAEYLSGSLDLDLHFIESKLLRKGSKKDVFRHFFSCHGGVFSCIECRYKEPEITPLDAVLERSGLIRPGTVWRAPNLYLLGRDNQGRCSLFYEDLLSDGSNRVLRQGKGELTHVAYCLGRMSLDLQCRLEDAPPSTKELIPRRLGLSKEKLSKVDMETVNDVFFDDLPKKYFIEEARQFVQSLKDNWERLRALPYAPNHYDANRGNVFLNTDKRGIVIIDWEHARVSPLGSEICQFLYSSMWGIKSGKTKAVRFGYDREEDVLKSYISGMERPAREVEFARIGMNLKLINMYLYRSLPKLCATGNVPSDGENLARIRDNIRILVEKMVWLRDAFRSL